MDIMEISKKLQKELKMISIPTIKDYDRFEKDRDKAWDNDLESCPCCGKGIKNQVFFIHSAYGGMAYIPINEETESGRLDDTWEMFVGSECKKKFPKEYIFKNKH